MKAKLKYIFMVSFFALFMAACADDPIYVTSGEIPDGEATITLSASFDHFTESKLSRANATPNGDILDKITSLWVIIYDKDGNLFRKPAKVEISQNVDEIKDIKIEKLPFGEYYIVGVANPKKALEDELSKAIDSENNLIKTLNGLKNFKVEWDDNTIAKNGEMICCFKDISGTATSREDSSSDETSSDNTPSNEPENVTLEEVDFASVKINRPGMKLAGRLRRCASKITIDFDGSGLLEGVEVYIKEARICDIAEQCHLGDNNAITEDTKNLMKSSSQQVISYVIGTIGETSNNDENVDTQAESNGNSSDTPDWSTISKTWSKISDEDGFKTLDVTKLYDGNLGVNGIHDHRANALYFYENLQENNFTPKKTKKPVLDSSTGSTKYEKKDGIEFGTYIEVEAYYKSKQAEGKIKYRFMLGMNATDNFKAFRNIHYQLTLKLKGNGTEADWHMDFEEQVLEVTQPHIVNYQGRYFVPNYKDDKNDYTLNNIERDQWGNVISVEGFANLGHYFTNDNYIEISSYKTSYSTDGKRTQEWEPYRIQYLVDGKYVDEKPDNFMLEIVDNQNDKVEQRPDGKVKKQRLLVKPQTPNEINISANIGSSISPSPYNLASSSGGAGVIENTANCYIVNSIGDYTLPLVYGNAITQGRPLLSSYEYTGDHPEKDEDRNPNILYIFKNHLNEDISSPYIKENFISYKEEDGEMVSDGYYCEPDKAKLIWQDVDGLVTVEEGAYDSNLYSGHGGIRFNVAKAQQGNAVIGIYDREGRVMWSWHIWVTSFKGFEENVKVTKIHDKVNSLPEINEFELMSINLGWCSENDAPVYFYPERECKIRIVSGNLDREVVVKQKSHMSFPRGNNTYYQWGRKDPFWGVTTTKGDNKPIYPAAVSDNTKKMYTPKRFYPDGDVINNYDDKRRTTLRLFTNKENDNIPENEIENDPYYFDYSQGNRLIQEPDKWHNPPRRKTQDYLEEGQTALNPFDSRNETFYNLWGQQAYTTYPTWYYSAVKTVYDPCPVGYMVPHHNAFTTFTFEGQNYSGNDWTTPTNEYESKLWYEAAIQNIDWKEALNLNPAWKAPYTENLFELYTDETKLQSIIFPENGYRDWDNEAQITNYRTGESIIGFVWAKSIEDIKCQDILSPPTWDGKVYYLPDAAFNFEFSRAEKYAWPVNRFNTCDGMPIRPVVIE